MSRWKVLTTAVLLAAGTTGCVKRVYEAPGLSPREPMTVPRNMRVETFDVGEWEVRAFRIPITEENVRRYQFLALRNGVQERTFNLELLDDGTWVLLEARPDGIHPALGSWKSEPAYGVVRRLVIQTLGGTAP